MDRAIIVILRALGWLILMIGSLVGIYAIIASPPENGGVRPTFETDVAYSPIYGVIVDLAIIFGSILLWALISTVAIAAEALLDMRDKQSATDQ